MLFTANQTLLDGYDRYEAGQEYDIPEDRARYLVSLGWGTAPDLPEDDAPAGVSAWSAPATVTLQPDDVASGTDTAV